MARAIVGPLNENGLFVDEFNRFARILAELTPRQLVVAVRSCQSFDELMDEGNDQGKASMTCIAHISRELIPDAIPNSGEAKAALWEITGKGLATAESTLGGIAFTPTQLLRDLMIYVESEVDMSTENKSAIAN